MSQTSSFQQLIERANRQLYRLIGQQSYERFIVLTRSRTGSNMLMTFLDAHPNVRAQREIFANLNGRSYQSILDSIYGKYPPGIQAVGFKLFYYHPLDEEAPGLWETILADRAIKIIHLKRRNILRTLVSRKIAGMQDLWVSSKETAVHQQQLRRVSFTVEELASLFAETRGWEEEYDAKFHQHPLITIHYEDLLANPQARFNEVTRFLGVPSHPPKTSLKKQNPEGLSQLISNYDTLKFAFADTEWGHFFDA